jgi:hypothetical protein
MLVLAALTIVSGCAGSDDELPREAVSGSVKFHGEPLKDGRIEFRPTGGSATAGVATVVDGEYSIDRSVGLVPAKYQVMISSGAAPAAADTVAPAGMPGDARPPVAAKEPIPSKYNSKTALTAEVKQGGPNTFDFTLEAK